MNTYLRADMPPFTAVQQSYISLAIWSLEGEILIIIASLDNIACPVPCVLPMTTTIL